MPITIILNKEIGVELKSVEMFLKQVPNLFLLYESL